MLLGEGTHVQDSSGLFVPPRISTSRVVIRDREGKTLYAVYGMTTYGEWIGPKYVPADCQEEAGRVFCRLHVGPWATLLAAPAVGFFVHDEHGEKLSAGGSRLGNETRE